MTAIIDYGVGNLFSLRSSFAAIGEDAEVTADPERIRSADRVILPGVGAFEDAARKLRESGLDEVVREEAAKGKPLLGICLGMQMLFERSYEYGEHPGLGLLKGVIRPMAGRIPENLKIPQMGIMCTLSTPSARWNAKSPCWPRWNTAKRSPPASARITCSAASSTRKRAAIRDCRSCGPSVKRRESHDPVSSN